MKLSESNNDNKLKAKLISSLLHHPGLIVRVEASMVVLLSDLTMHELKVLARDLQLCADVSSGVDSVGKFQFGDLVLIE